MTKFNLVKDILMIALISFLIYDRINPKPVASEKIVTVIRDTVTTPVIVTKPVPVVKPQKLGIAKPYLHRALPTPGFNLHPIHQNIDSISILPGADGRFPVDTSLSQGNVEVMYRDTIDIHPRIRIYAEHDAIDLVESRYKADIKLDTTVIIKEKPCPRLPYFSFYAFSQMSNTGASVGAAVAGRKVIAGYSYDMIQKSHQVTIGYRIASL